MRRALITDMLSALIVLLLIYASLGKLPAYPAFVIQLHTHPLLKPFAGVVHHSPP